MCVLYIVCKFQKIYVQIKKETMPIRKFSQKRFFDTVEVIGASLGKPHAGSKQWYV